MAVKPDDDIVYVQMATRIPKPLHRRLREYAVQTDRSLMSIVQKALEDHLGKYMDGKKK